MQEIYETCKNAIIYNETSGKISMQFVSRISERTMVNGRHSGAKSPETGSCPSKRSEATWCPKVTFHDGLFEGRVTQLNIREIAMSTRKLMIQGLAPMLIVEAGQGNNKSPANRLDAETMVLEASE